MLMPVGTAEEAMDAVYVLGCVAFFALSWGFVKLCERV
jgi:hypothetical protein